ncbi:hypothetical protein B5X24_HaOG213546 [Helicoverpa armigera]|nr:hypothetical protein B5X24_HaOG213546 [Helicoverpa armigera]
MLNRLLFKSDTVNWYFESHRIARTKSLTLLFCSRLLYLKKPGIPPKTLNVKKKPSLYAAKPNTQVYISRQHCTTKAKYILEYVRQKLKYAPRVQLLESRHNANFKAFVVRVPTCFLHLVLDENFWPQDVVFRR